MYNILVVDDDKEIVESIEIFLKNEGYNVYKAYNGMEALDVLVNNDVHLILMDIMMPKLDGIKATIKIREEKNIPIILVSAKSEDTDKIIGLNIGADDYITKPFEIREVLARVQVQLRRKEEKETGIERDLSFKDMVLNRDTFQVRIDGRILSKITKQEFAILELLLRNPKQVFSKEDIFEYAWDEPYMGETKTLDVHISNIRKKIKQVTSDEYIETVWGIGYRLHA